jgi:hypothetical protein
MIDEASQISPWFLSGLFPIGKPFVSDHRELAIAEFACEIEESLTISTRVGHRMGWQEKLCEAEQFPDSFRLRCLIGPTSIIDARPQVHSDVCDEKSIGPRRQP